MCLNIQDLQMLSLIKNKYENFQSLEDVGRDSWTQLQVAENSMYYYYSTYDVTIGSKIHSKEKATGK